MFTDCDAEEMGRDVVFRACLGGRNVYCSNGNSSLHELYNWLRHGDTINSPTHSVQECLTGQ